MIVFWVLFSEREEVFCDDLVFGNSVWDFFTFALVAFTVRTGKDTLD